MENYQLQNNEVPLYRGKIILLPVSKKEKPYEAELVLSNLNFIFAMEVKQVFRKISQTEVYDLKSVKFYNDLPHIIKKGDLVELYLLSCEKFIKFPNKKEATTFHDAVMRLLSGNSKFVRAVKKVKKEINETEEALDVDITGAAKVVADVALDVAGTVTGW